MKIYNKTPHSIFLLIFSVLFTLPVIGLAQSGSDLWKPAIKITEQNESESEMTLDADSYGRLHFFWSPLDTPVIYYSRWDGVAWTYPIDVISREETRAPAMIIDHKNIVHLIWNQTQQIYYSNAPIELANQPKAWSPPVAVANGFTHSQILIDAQDNLYIVYPGLGSSGPYMTMSQNSGLNWSEPKSISPTSRQDSAADYVRAVVTDDGSIHVVWSEYQLPQGWPPIGIFYSQSESYGKSWSIPQKIAGDSYHQVDIANYKDNTIHIAWNGAAPVGGRYHQVSSDGGRNWSNINTLFSKGEAFSDGGPRLVVDQSGNLHMVTTADHRVWYTSFDGVSWQEPLYIPTGDEAGIPPIGQPIDAYKIRQIERVVMTASQEDALNIVFWDARPLGGPVSYWFSTTASQMKINTSTQPAQNKAMEAQIAPTINPTNQTPSPFFTSENPDLNYEEANASQTTWPILISILPVLILVSGVVAYYFIKAQR
jgi:hypothetical protein